MGSVENKEVEVQETAQEVAAPAPAAAPIAPVIAKVYEGKGEYAITSVNVSKLQKHLANYNATGEWKWALQDCLGVKADGTFGPRFARVQAALKDVDDDNAQMLLLTMSETKTKPVTEIKRTVRDASAPKAEDVKIEAKVDDLIGELPVSQDEKDAMTHVG